MPNQNVAGKPKETLTRLKCAGGEPLSPVGLGTWKIEKNQAPGLVEEAIRAGYRHFDCACDYGNEKEVGKGIASAVRQGLCRRDELWITSKLWNTYHAPEHVRPALERSLDDLGLDAIDAYLIHFPIALKYVPFEERYPPEWVYDPAAAEPRMEFAPVPIQATWQAMEEVAKAGLARHIGVCNFNCALLRDLLTCATLRPAMLQVELHPYLTQSKLVRFCAEEEIAVTAFSPFGASSYLSLGMAEAAESALQEPVVREIAEARGKSAAQVLLRWGIQRGTAVIPKTSRPERLAENLSVFDFALSDEEMATIGELNRNRRFNDPGVFCEQAFGTFCPIYE